MANVRHHGPQTIPTRRSRRQHLQSPILEQCRIQVQEEKVERHLASLALHTPNRNRFGDPQLPSTLSRKRPLLGDIDEDSFRNVSRHPLGHQQSSANGQSPYAQRGKPSTERCLVCGSSQHHFRMCEATTTVFNQPTLLKRDSKSRFVHADGLRICWNWNRSFGCTESACRNSDHTCSLCDRTVHNAQACRDC